MTPQEMQTACQRICQETAQRFAEQGSTIAALAVHYIGERIAELGEERES